MKRMILAELASWRDKSDRKPLLLTGVRQCGKTYILQKFGREYFDDVAYVNLERNPEIGRVFEQNFDPQRIIDELGNLFLGRPILPGKTLLILDEIQTQPVAISALKYFCEDIPELAVIGAGSLLGVSLRREEASFPVGKVDRLQMYPMNFCEFMWASGYENYQDMLRKHPLEERVPDYVMSKMERLFYEYLVVGGMPEAVAVWVRSKDLAQVADIQDNILFGYENDFAKYAPVSEYTNIRAIWRSVPEQLARENNKFVFSRVKKSARAKDLEQSIGWLVDAGLIHLVNKVENAQIPLSVHADSSYYKVYFCDTGLLCRKANFSLRSILERSPSTGGFRGSLTENYLLNELLALDYAPYFWRSGNTAELDFLIEEAGSVIPIEAKTHLNTQAKSYRTFIRQFRPRIGYKFSLSNCGVSTDGETTTYSVPLFMIWRMGE